MKQAPLAFVLFGSTGDLARLKLLPALNDMWKESILPGKFKLFTVGRQELDTPGYFEYLAEAEDHPFNEAIPYLNPEYVQVDFENPEGFMPLWQKLSELQDYKILYYLALGPEAVNVTIERFEDESAQQMMQGRKASIVVEKPFGASLEDSRQMNKRLGALFHHPFVHRNDHYLNRDTVQAIMNMRQNNIYVCELLNGECIEQIELLVSEEVDLGSRASYFEGRGMAVDWLQSHMLQIMATLCAELDTDNFCQAKADFISSLELTPNSIIKGQYNSYKTMPDVQPSTQTETFLALQMTSRNPKWEGVNFRFVAGKAMDRKEVAIRIKLRREHTKLGESFIVLIDPPGGNPLLHPTARDEFEETIMDAYMERSNQFVSVAEVEAQWYLTDEVKKAMQGLPLQYYPSGTAYEYMCQTNPIWC